MSKVEQSITIAAPREGVWKAMTTEISRWWTAPYFVDSQRATGLSMESQLGGRLVETWADAGAGYLVGQVVEWLPYERLGFTWMEKAWSGVSTVVWVEFHPEGRGTRVTLVHEGFDRVPDGEVQRSGYDAGWGDLLNKFKTYLEKK